MEHNAKYLLGQFELEPDRYLLIRDSKPVPLSRKRFEVLLYLVRHRDRVVPRKELIEKFWDGLEVYEENLTKCLSEVRKALEDQQKPHRFIETIPAVGYRYIGPLEKLEESVELNDRSLIESEQAEPAGSVDLPLASPPIRNRRGLVAVTVSLFGLVA